MKKYLPLTAFALLSLLPLAGCVALSGGDTQTSPTIGQQLIDLQKAKGTGAITEQEYEAQKQKLLGK